MQYPNAPATYALIAVNLFISLYALYADRRFIGHFAFNVEAVARGGQHYRIVTSSFLHGGLIHLAFNMLTLLFFGPAVESLLGKLGFLVVYFGAIIASGIVSLIARRREPSYSSIGASDAVSGVVLSFCAFHPFAPIYVFPIPFGVPAIVYGALFILISARMMGAQGGRIAHEGHLGGALGGLVLTLLMRPDALTRFFG